MPQAGHPPPEIEAAFFAGAPTALAIHRAVSDRIRSLGPARIRIGRSQIGFSRTRPFAATWMPGRHLHGPRPPLVLTLFLRHRDPSPRWKEIVEPAPGRFTHHMELRDPAEVDDEVRALLVRAWDEAA